MGMRTTDATVIGERRPLVESEGWQVNAKLACHLRCLRTARRQSLGIVATERHVHGRAGTGLEAAAAPEPTAARRAGHVVRGLEHLDRLRHQQTRESDRRPRAPTAKVARPARALGPRRRAGWHRGRALRQPSLMAPPPLDRQLRRLQNGLTYYAGLNRPPVGPTPRDLVWQRDRARLWRYRSAQRRIRPPMLIVHSLVSRSYILDLLPSNSMVGFLVEEGFDVFMLDWESAVPADSENTLETYVDQYLVDAVSVTCAQSHAEGVTLVGYCFGGVLALLLAASSSGQRVRNLVTLTTPCDFSQMGFMSQMFVDGRLDAEDVIDETGLVPGVV